VVFSLFCERKTLVKLRVLAVCAALVVVSLSACGSGNTPDGLVAAPVANAVVPLTRTVVVTAVYGKKALPNIQVTLTHNTWPDGKLIAKGKTGPQGRVKLSGNWTEKEIICVGGKRSPGNDSRVCQMPFPAAVTLQFKFTSNG
jgi:predicted lipoprotein